MTSVNPSDTTTTISDLKKTLLAFRDARNWEQFHTPKNLASAISIEAGELMEHFLWKNPSEIDELLEDPKAFEEVQDELADIICYCLNLANVMKIDVSQAVASKIVKNGRKYPAETSRDLRKRPAKIKQSV